MSFDPKVSAGSNQIALPVIENKDKAKIVAEVVNQRVHSLTCIAFAELAQYGDHAAPIINKQVEKLKKHITEYFENWDLIELEQYQQWQRSPVVTKIHNLAQAGLIKDAKKLDEVLTPEEHLEVKQFNKSRIGQMKFAIDAHTKELFQECVQEAHEEILAPFCY
ncbi:MAG: hypothetical protein JSR37_09580 [Verrucomicrobia bacterium]|nr:hypothetical protein [Verrucomicrobiota bacterium]MBS0636800.1 hypothetical protein [Verrucomicrobiota bacterium]